MDDLERLLLARSESEHVEFKEAKSNFHFEKLVDYCVALANEGGGRIVFGVTDKRPRSVVGSQAFEIPERTAGALHERLQIKVRWHELQHPNGRVLVFEVPGRPPGHPLQHDGCYWMRAGDELVPMSIDQIRRIVSETQPRFEEQAARTGCGEEDVVALLDVQGYFDLRQRPMPSTRTEIVDVLATKGFVRREVAGFTITNMGALLLAKRLGDFDTVSRKAVRVIVYDGPTKLNVKDGKDLTYPRGYATGFEGLVDYIHAQLPASEEIAAALRQTTYAYPKKAIREIVGNALVHQDLTETGSGVTVEVYEDRVEVTNPGRPLLEIDRFIDENQSRNERFADALRQLGVCDERGHGMDSVVSHIEAFQLPPYQCRLGTRHTTVTLSRYKGLRALAPDERVQAVYQHCCLRFVTNQITNNESVRARFKIEKQNAATASRLLAEAVAAKKIRPADAGAASKIMRYVPYWA
ncbi:MAG: putative DNA binding domain-containing protein [Rubrivivax sp.]|nr:putative DNA binding domain-containing protein [Rubrivivax sp.]